MATMSELHEQVAGYLEHARWFGGKGRGHRVTAVERIASLEGSPQVLIELVTVDYDEGDREFYQVPLAVYAEPAERLGHALVATGTQGWAYDAVHDRDAMALYLAAFDGGTQGEGLGFHRVGDHELDRTQHSTLFSGEQSNSSVAFGEDSLFKLFRKITPGINPDIEIHRALTTAGSDHVAALYGWVETELDGEVLHLGMLQQFLRTASDGWDVARASVRNLLVDEAADEARDAGGDFAAEAGRLGVAIREVHESLAATFESGREDGAAIADRMRARLTATPDVPELAAHTASLAAVFERVAGLGEVPVQRVHGDLHLGQTLRTVLGWKLVDFEGEPVKPLAERVLPDSVWRDVAGMLRSLDYAARSVAYDFVTTAPALGPDHDGDPELRAVEWVMRNRARFLEGYTGGRPLTVSEQALLDAYEADKAAYEVVYEARNRPDWIAIPLAALDRITAKDRTTPS